MNGKHWIVTTLFVGALAAGATAALQQEKKPEKAPVPAASADDPMMKAMMELGSPGPAHKVLEHKIGKWTAAGKWFMPGSTEPYMTGEYQSEAKWINDGRFVEETVTGDFAGAPFRGTAIMGYDNLKKKYVQTWMDNMSTGLYFAEGTYDAASKTFTFTGESPDATMTKYVKSRSTDKMIDADHGVAQSFQPGPDGKEYMAMEITYTRVK
jgi:hypothetical protein